MAKKRWKKRRKKLATMNLRRENSGYGELTTRIRFLASSSDLMMLARFVGFSCESVMLSAKELILDFR